MQSPVLTHDEITQRYNATTNALCEIGGAYLFLGRLDEAKHLLSTTLQLLEAHDAGPRQRLNVLLHYGRVLIIDITLMRGDVELALSILQQALRLAEAAQDQQAHAEALSLLGQTRYIAVVVKSVKNGAAPDSPQSEGKYTEALAYQQQALQLRETLQDTQGISESLFQIGVIHERWQQYEQAREYYMKAREIAEQHGHLFEQSEPARHFAIHALKDGRFDEALSFAQRALQLREAAGFRPYQPLDHLLLRDIYLAKGDTQQAERHTQQAMALAAQMGLETLVSSMPNIRELLANPER